MKQNGKRILLWGIILVVAFVAWTGLILFVDVQPLGQNGTNIGFATLNCWFHKLTGVHISASSLQFSLCEHLIQLYSNSLFIT